MIKGCRWSVLLVLNILLMCLSGCYQRVQGAYPLSQYTLLGAGAGAAGGAAVGHVGHLGVAAGTTTLAGAAVGALYASRQDSRNLTEKNVQIERLGDEVTIILPTDNFFEPGTPTLRFDSYPAMESLAKLLQGYADNKITIAGYTDNMGGEAYNQWLSTVEAQSISAYLWSRGIPWRELQTVGYGSQHPIASNLTVRGKAANRHIEISLRQKPVHVMPRP